MLTRIVLILLLWALPCAAGPAAESWRLVNQDLAEGITVSSRVTPEGLVEFRAITHVRSRLGALVALFEDVENMPRWVDRTERVEVLERVSESEVVARTLNSAPWPLRDRDVVVRSRIEQDPGTLAVTIIGHGEPGYMPASEDHVRVPTMDSFWHFIPQGEGMVEVVFQGYADPGGNVPTAVYNWVAKTLLWSTPHRTLQGLRAWVVRPEYRERKYPFIVEPPSPGSAAVVQDLQPALQVPLGEAGGILQAPQ